MFRKVKDVVKMVFCTGIFVMGLTACSMQQDDKLAEGFDAEVVKAAAQELVGYINEDNMEAFCSVPMGEEMRNATTVDGMKSVFAQYIGDRGDFKKYKSCVVVGAKDQEGNDYAAAVVVAKYENQTVTYTITYDKEMNLIGFYLK